MRAARERPQKTLAERVTGPRQVGVKVVAAGFIGTATLALPSATTWAAAVKDNMAAPHAEPASPRKYALCQLIDGIHRSS